MDAANLTHHFLIAMPAMADSNFAGTLTLIAEHNANGALGVIVNRPTEMTVGELFEKVQIKLSSENLAKQPIYFGGPVQTDRGFVLHRPVGQWHSSLKVSSEIALTSSKDVLESLGAGGEPKDVLITLGYAGWSAGQLEEELSQNAWLNLEADPRILFDLPPEARLDAALGLLGINFTNLSSVAGHA